MLPLNHALESRYFDRMKRGLDEKLRLVELATPGTVLNGGAGGPELSLAFQDAGHKVLSLDDSPDSIERLEAAGLDAIQGAAENMRELVHEPVSNIVFSSVLHEVFSYAEGDGREAVRDVLRSAFDLLEPGGRILIRDGVKPRGSDATLVTEKLEYRYLAEQYLDMSPLVPDEVYVERVGLDEWRGDLASVTEILNTINWGLKSFPRECQELFGVFNADDYVTELALAGFDPCHHAMCFNTYKKHLLGKAHCTDHRGRVLWLAPAALWWGVKPTD